MGIKFGGDMDDPHNPASPFMAVSDVEQIAADMLGQMDDNRERQNAVEIAFIDMFVGTRLSAKDGDESPLYRATKFSKAAIKCMYEVRQLLRDPENVSTHDMLYAAERLSQFIPPGYE